MRHTFVLLLTIAASFAFPLGQLRAVEPALPLLLNETFDAGAAAWQPTDADAWKIAETPHGKVYSLWKQSKYAPPHRSPVNFALLKQPVVTDFALQAKVQSTIKDYAHRDMCLVFGYQDPAHFYYVHFGKETDDRANQIFIVNGAPRIKISTKTTAGTPWDDAWHTVRVTRDVQSGLIEVFFDDLATPAMTATDKSFAWGQVGVGSFDDIGNIDDVQLWGTVKKADK